MLDTLEYAQKGGRIGKIKAAAADFLGLKPILVFENGECSDLSVARNFNGGISKLMSLMKKDIEPGSRLTVFHGDCIEKAENLRQEILKEFSDLEIEIAFVSAVIGIFSGPGALGIAYVRRD